MIRIVSWNMAGRVHRKPDGSPAPWHILAEMDADIALLQEARRPPQDIPGDRFEINPSPWAITGFAPNYGMKTAVVRLSDRVKVDWIPAVAIGQNGFEVSRPGTLAAAVFTPVDGSGESAGEPLVAASMYSNWQYAHPVTGQELKDWSWGDVSALRIIADLSRLIGHPVNHRIIAAGDLNIMYGYGEGGDEYAAARYATVFDRMAAMGIPFVGPQYPNGRQADPWPAELPPDSKNVPTFCWGKDRTTAYRQLDFVFASAGMKDAVSVRALNSPDEWGPSDHCRIVIDVR